MSKKVYLGMIGDIMHPGLINIINEGAKYGDVMIGLFTDKAIATHKRLPYLTYGKMLIRKIREIAGENAAVIIMGDLNFNQYSQGYEILTKSGVVEDCINVAQKKIKVAGTFNNFEKDRKSDARLDHILVTKNINVLEYNVLLDTYPDQYGENRFPSDHFPVVVKINLKMEN